MSNFKDLVKESYYTIKEISDLLGYTVVHTRNLMIKNDLVEKMPISNELGVKKAKFDQWFETIKEKMKQE